MSKKRVTTTPTTAEIVFNTRRKAFTHQGKPLSGLLPTIRTLLFPSYSWELARTRWKSQQRLKTTVPRATTTKTKQTKKKRSFHGKKNGQKLDRQLLQAVQLAREHNLAPLAFIDPRHRRQLLLPRQAAQKLQRFVHRMIPATKNFLALCHRLKLRLFAAQTVVGDVRARVATAVDVTLMNHKNEPVLIENKLGYSNYLHASTGPMLNPYEAHSNSQFNQHQVQLAMTTLLYNAQFPQQPAKQSFVWRHDEDGITVSELQPWARNNAPLLFERIHS